jgi:hypothetical protein
VSFHPDGDRSENSDAVGAMTVDMIAGTPMEQEYRAKSPHPDRLQDLLDKLGNFDEGFTGWSDADIRGIAAPTLITVGDYDAVYLNHMVRFLQLRGGDVNGDFVGVPSPQRGISGHHALLRPGAHGAGPRCGAEVSGRTASGGLTDGLVSDIRFDPSSAWCGTDPDTEEGAQQSIKNLSAIRGAIRRQQQRTVPSQRRRCDHLH